MDRSIQKELEETGAKTTFRRRSYTNLPPVSVSQGPHKLLAFNPPFLGESADAQVAANPTWFILFTPEFKKLSWYERDFLSGLVAGVTQEKAFIYWLFKCESASLEHLPLLFDIHRETILALRRLDRIKFELSEELARTSKEHRWNFIRYDDDLEMSWALALGRINFNNCYHFCSQSLGQKRNILLLVATAVLSILIVAPLTMAMLILCFFGRQTLFKSWDFVPPLIGMAWTLGLVGMLKITVRLDELSILCVYVIKSVLGTHTWLSCEETHKFFEFIIPCYDLDEVLVADETADCAQDLISCVSSPGYHTSAFNHYRGFVETYLHQEPTVVVHSKPQYPYIMCFIPTFFICISILTGLNYIYKVAPFISKLTMITTIYMAFNIWFSSALYWSQGVVELFTVDWNQLLVPEFWTLAIIESLINVMVYTMTLGTRAPAQLFSANTVALTRIFIELTQFFLFLFVVYGSIAFIRANIVISPPYNCFANGMFIKYAVLPQMFSQLSLPNYLSQLLYFATALIQNFTIVTVLLSELFVSLFDTVPKLNNYQSSLPVACMLLIYAVSLTTHLVTTFPAYLLLTRILRCFRSLVDLGVAVIFFYALGVVYGMDRLYADYHCLQGIRLSDAIHQAFYMNLFFLPYVVGCVVYTVAMKLDQWSQCSPCVYSFLVLITLPTVVILIRNIYFRIWQKKYLAMNLDVGQWADRPAEFWLRREKFDVRLLYLEEQQFCRDHYCHAHKKELGYQAQQQSSARRVYQRIKDCLPHLMMHYKSPIVP